MISSMHFFGGRAADFRLRAGAEALGHLRAELDQPLGLRHGQRLGVGVGDDELDAAQAGGDHVVDGVAAAAADAEHGDAGLQFGDVRLLQIDRHCLSSFAFPAASPPRPPMGLSPSILETVSQPLTHAMQPSARSGHPETGDLLSPDGSRSSPPADRSAVRPPSRKPGPWPLRAGRPRRAAGRCARCVRECGAPLPAGRRAGWRRRSARRACRRHCRSRTCSSRSRTSSSVSSMRARMMRVITERGICSGTSPSSPIGWIETRSRSSALPGSAEPCITFSRSACVERASRGPWPCPS